MIVLIKTIDIIKMISIMKLISKNPNR